MAFTTLLHSSPNLFQPFQFIPTGAHHCSSTPILLFLHEISIFLRILLARFVPSRAGMQPASPFCSRIETGHSQLFASWPTGLRAPTLACSVSCNCMHVPHSWRHDWYVGPCISMYCSLMQSSPSKEWDSSQEALSSSPTVLISSCVMWRELLNFSEPQFLYLYSGA